MQFKFLLLGLCILFLAGCATSSSYYSYTYQRFPPKDALYVVNVYPESQKLPVSNPYYVIGKISLEGFASYGVNSGSLTAQAQQIARKRGADAIINAKTVQIYYGGDALMRFTGELIVYAPVVTK